MLRGRISSGTAIRDRSAIALLFAGIIALGCGRSLFPPPPEARVEPVVDVVHGVEIEDPYRWLEDQESSETRAWLASQEAYSESILGAGSVLRAELRVRLTELMDVDDVGSPVAAGEYQLFLLRRRGEPAAKIVRRLMPDPESDESNAPIPADGDYQVVIDPLDIRGDGTTSVEIRDVSADGKLLLYSVRDGGRDETQIRIHDLGAGADLETVLPPALYDRVAFDHEGSGFYYTARSRVTGARVLFHQLGTDRAADPVLFGEGYGPRTFVGMNEMAEGRWLVFSAQHGWQRHELFLQSTQDGAGPVVPITEGLQAHFYATWVPHQEGPGGPASGEIYLRTDLGAPNHRLVAVDPQRPQREDWREVLSEGEHFLQAFEVVRLEGAGELIYATYLENASTVIRIFDREGRAAENAAPIEVPPFHSARFGAMGEGKARLTLESFHRSEETYEVDLLIGEQKLATPAKVTFDGSEIEVSQQWYASKDGTRVPLFVVHRKGLTLDGDRPTLLYGYGGFLAAVTPRFDAPAAVWVENGGVYAVANLRGGSEFGESWHRQGMLENKQDVFDDFLSAAEFLIESDYTRPERLAIRGVSNGGLLVGAALTQRPELFRAVLCGFPDLDMVRFYTFTETNNMPALLEYGDAEIQEQFEYLVRYSPYQAVRDRVSYPAVMLTSGDLDTRVSPLQARKMTARLQSASRSGLPVILRYNERAGHAGGRSRQTVIEDAAAELTFLMTQTGMSGVASTTQ